MAPSRTGRLFPPPPACTLPHDLVLEIVARSDVATVVRSAVTCKPLRRDILSPAFIRRVCQHGAVVPRFLVGYLGVHRNAGENRAASCFSLVHPATPAATFFSEDHLAPLLSRRLAAADLSRRYMPLTSRNGLAVFRAGSCRICLYNPMTGAIWAYLSRPWDICRRRHEVCTFVLLTAADGIGCPFILVATDSSVSQIQTLATPGSVIRGWGSVIRVAALDRHRGYRGYVNAHPHSCAVVLDGLIHWLMCISYGSPPNFYILTYDVPRTGTPAATTTGSIEVPKACLPDSCDKSEVHLTTSPDGRLSLLVADRFTISVWLLSGSSDWARQSVIDTEAIVRSVSPLPQSDRPSKVDFVRSSAGLRSGAVLLRPFMSWDFLNDKGEKGLLLLDVATEEMRRVDKKEGFPYEVDMQCRRCAELPRRKASRARSTCRHGYRP